MIRAGRTVLLAAVVAALTASACSSGGSGTFQQRPGTTGLSGPTGPANPTGSSRPADDSRNSPWWVATYTVPSAGSTPTPCTCPNRSLLSAP